MAFQVAINRSAAFLAPQATAEGASALTGVGKLVMRYGSGVFVPTTDAALFLTRAEQSALFTGGRRLLVFLGTRIFLAAAVLDFARRLLVGGEEQLTVSARFQIIEAHLLKGGPLWARAIGVGEQVLFLLLNAAGETLGDALAGAVANWDDPQHIPAEWGNFSQRTYYSDLLSPAADFDRVDSIFEAPGFFLQPGQQAAELAGQVTFPIGPRPSVGRRR